MIIKDKIYIDLDSEPVTGDVFKLLTYENPDYHQKKNLGLPVFNIPKEIKSYNLRGRSLEIMRGEAMKVKPYIGHLEYNFEHSDHPISIRYVNNDFDLDEFQEGAIDAMTKKRQGIIHAVTSAGKSLMILKAISVIGQKALIVVHRKVLMEQILEDIEKYIRDEKGNKITPGIIGGGKYTDGPIVVAIDKSLAKHIDQARDGFGIAILDECHIAPANTIFGLLNSLNSRLRFGFSGTLKRKDQKEFLIFSTFGEVIYRIGKEILLEKKRVVPVDVRIVESETQFDWDAAVEGLEAQGKKNPTTAARQLQDKTIHLDPARNVQILRLVDKLFREGGKTIVLSRFVDPCYRLQEALQRDFGVESGVITGQDAKEALESYRAMKHKDLKVIFATIGCVSTGVSISDLDNIVLISPLYTNELLLHQIRGRLMRTAEGKTHGTLYYIYDQFIFQPWKLKKFLSIMRN